MGHLIIHRQPLCRPLWPCPYHLHLLFRPLAGLGGWPTRLKVLSNAQIPPVSRGGDPDECWRYQTHYPSVRGSETVLTAILLTRVYALWDRSRIILWGLLAYYIGFAGFTAVRCSLRSNIPFSIYHFSVGDYPGEISGFSLGTPDFTGVYQRFIKGRVRVK
jgi:hypothetical protein